MRKAVVLLSGGLDSSVALYMAKSEGFEVHALSFDYGQKHNKELECAKATAQKAGALEHNIVSLKLNLWGGSSLTDAAIAVEDGDLDRTDIPPTYVPARNMVFLSVAASYAEAIGAQDIFIGVSEVDYSGYVDCREEFISAMENAINMGTVAAVEQGRKMRIHAPFIHLNKTDEIKIGEELGVDWSLTWSCYRGGEKPCGTCDSCLLRAKAFAQAGVIDTAL
ncbi:7-cyano-7-deazaguanine synthase QueC [Roseimarinus sediminis]|uniref:7-cyano-7-deazaguanine synthase QueC n=1 Tax=Roseimarinus sediminis TaxID=1610899 RepID=UPI003D1E901A